MLPLRGEFWHEKSTDVKVNGALSRASGLNGEAVLTVDGNLLPPKRRVRNGSNGEYWELLSESADEMVENFSPFVGFGLTDDGVKATLLNCRLSRSMVGPSGKKQCITAQTILVGAHVSGHDQLYSAIRFEVDEAWRWEHLGTSPLRQTLSDGAYLAFEHSAKSAEFTYVSASRRTLRDLEGGIVNAMATLAELCIGDRVTGVSYAVQIDGESEWLPVLFEYDRLQPDKRHRRPLIPFNELTLQTVGRWLDVATRLDNLADAVAQGPTGVVEIQVISTCAIAEGVHSRLYGNGDLSEVIAKVQRKLIRSAAYDAGMRQFDTLNIPKYRDHVADSLRTSLGALSRKAFATRISELGAAAVGTVPEVLEDFDAQRLATFKNWSHLVTSSRNSMAHQSREPLGAGPASEKYDYLLAAVMSLDWVLRIELLGRAGVRPSAIRSALLADNRFEMYRANVRAILEHRV